MNTKYLLIIIVSLCVLSCSKKSDQKENIVQVGDKILNRAELNESLPHYPNPEDSIMAAEYYIRMWITDNLLYDVAQKNIADKAMIEQLVENYRKSLIIYQYEEQLVNEKLTKNINENDMWAYFENNKDKFKLDKPLIKGLFLRIPVNAPQLDAVRNWYRAISPTTIDNIGKYCVQNGGNYDYFSDNWRDFEDITNKWPARYKNETDLIKNNKYIEQQDSTYCYFLNITNYLLPGDNAPFEFAKPAIRELLINQKKMEFLRKMEDDLYNKAMNKGQIKFFGEQ